MSPSLSLLSPAHSSALQGLEVRAEVSSTPVDTPLLQFSISEELDVVSIVLGDVKDSPPHNKAFELLEVVTRTVARLNINWPAEKQEVDHQRQTLSNAKITTSSPGPAFLFQSP